MADKRQVKKSIKQLQIIKTWQLLILLILMLFVSATLLRMNNTGMIARRDAVASADKEGNMENLQARLYDLQRYSNAHMNADTGTFYLSEQYNRDVRRIAESRDSSDKALEIRKAADAVCQPQFRGWSPAYVRCYVDELNKHSSDEIQSSSLEMPNAALYKYSFASPKWSSDFAGWSLALCALITLVIIGRLLSLAVLRMMLKRHYREY